MQNNLLLHCFLANRQKKIQTYTHILTLSDVRVTSQSSQYPPGRLNMSDEIINSQHAITGTIKCTICLVLQLLKAKLNFT